MPLRRSHRPQASDGGGQAARPGGARRARPGRRSRPRSCPGPGRRERRPAEENSTNADRSAVAGQLVQVPGRVDLGPQHRVEPLRGERADRRRRRATPAACTTAVSGWSRRDAGEQRGQGVRGRPRRRRRPRRSRPSAASSARSSAAPAAAGPRRLISSRWRTPCAVTRCRATSAPSAPVPPVTSTVPSVASRRGARSAGIGGDAPATAWWRPGRAGAPDPPSRSAAAARRWPRRRPAAPRRVVGASDRQHEPVRVAPPGRPGPGPTPAGGRRGRRRRLTTTSRVPASRASASHSWTDRQRPGGGGPDVLGASPPTNAPRRGAVAAGRRSPRPARRRRRAGSAAPMPTRRRAPPSGAVPVGPAWPSSSSPAGTATRGAAPGRRSSWAAETGRETSDRPRRPVRRSGRRAVTRHAVRGRRGRSGPAARRRRRRAG